MRIVLTVPEDILREACNRITKFCEQHMMKEKLKMADNDVVSILNEKSSEVSSKQQMLKNIS